MTRKEVKKRIIEGVGKNELVVLKFIKSNAPEGLNYSKEFEYRGEMYDIVKSESKGDTIFYRCWWDNKETKLNKKLTHLIDNIIGKNTQNKGNQKRLVSFYKSLFHENTTNLIGVNPFYTSNSYYSANNFICSINCPAPPVPPPEKV